MMKKEKNELISIKNNNYIHCPACGHHDWESSYKRYGGQNQYVYCKSKTCDHQFSPDIKKTKEYSLYLFDTNKESVIQILEQSLKRLKEL